MDDDQIIARGGDEHDIASYAESNGATDPFDKLDKILIGQLADDYACNRVWEAWQVGTMTEDDFEPLTETVRVEEIKQAILQWVNDEVIGRNADLESTYDYDYKLAESTIKAHNKLITAGNEVKNEQRNILKKHGWKEGK